MNTRKGGRKREKEKEKRDCADLPMIVRLTSLRISADSKTDPSDKKIYRKKDGQTERKERNIKKMKEFQTSECKILTDNVRAELIN